jgi:prolyl 4-hydroxylase
MWNMKHLLPVLMAHLLVTTTTAEDGDSSYGLDVSFPIHGRVSINYPHLDHNVDPKHHPTPSRFEGAPLQPLGDRQGMYLEHLEGCRDAYQPLESYKCDQSEYNRMLMNRRQPQSMFNLTATGFKKIRAPPNLKKLVDEFWEKNKDKDKPENWPSGNSFVNHWDAPTTLVSVDDTGLRGSGANLKEHIWAAASATLEEWTQEELQPVSLYVRN